MPVRIEAQINPELLIWARKVSRLSTKRASDKLKVGKGLLEEWEGGKSKLSVSQLRKCATLYKIPLAIFYLSLPPELPKHIRDFRKLSHKIEDDIISFQLAHELRRAYFRREQAILLTKWMGETFKPFMFKTNLSVNIESLSKKARKTLGIDIENQWSWKDPYIALKNWIVSIEREGGLIFQCSRVDLDDMRGFSISEKFYPVIALNGADSPNARIFTLMHELGHLLINRGGLCDTIEYRGDSSQNQKIERFCNQFAALLLVPTSEFVAESQVMKNRAEKDWSKDDFEELSKKYSVSKEVILGRLYSLKRISRSFYETKLKDFKKQYLLWKKEKPTGGGNYYKTTLRNNGPALTRLVYSAQGNGIINSGDAADILNVKVTHLNQLYENMRQL